MSVLTFDTLKFVKTLKKSGIPEAQAEAISTAVQDSHEAAELATKADLERLERVTKTDLEKLETSLRHEMKVLGLQLTIRLGLIVAAFVTLGPSISRLLHLPA